MTGYFESNGAGAELTSAAVIRSGRTPLQGRFSLSGDNPNISDAASVARGLGLAIGYPGQQQWRTGMLNLPVFLDNSPEGFYDRLLASKNDPATGKPDPAAMKEGQSQVRSELGNRAATPTVAARSSVHPRKRSPRRPSSGGM